MKRRKNQNEAVAYEAIEIIPVLQGTTGGSARVKSLVPAGGLAAGLYNQIR